MRIYDLSGEDEDLKLTVKTVKEGDGKKVKYFALSVADLVKNEGKKNSSLASTKPTSRSAALMDVDDDVDDDGGG